MSAPSTGQYSSERAEVPSSRQRGAEVTGAVGLQLDHGGEGAEARPGFGGGEEFSQGCCKFY